MKDRDKLSYILTIILGSAFAFFTYVKAEAQTEIATARPKIAGPAPTVTPTPTVKPTVTPTPEEDEIIRIITEEVNLNVRVVDRNGRCVNNLPQTAFKVYEDNVLQPITSFAKSEVPTNYILAVDNSGSMRQLLEKVIEAGKIIVNTNRPGDETSIIRFISSDKIEIPQDFTPNKTDLTDALDNMFIEGGQTAVIDAVYLAAGKAAEHEKSSKPNEKRRRALILVSDGEDRNSFYSEKQLFDLLRENEVQIYVVGFTTELSNEGGFISKSPRGKAEALLKRIAEVTGGKAYFPQSDNELNEIARDIASELRMQYLISYMPSNDAKDGVFHPSRSLLTTVRIRRNASRLQEPVEFRKSIIPELTNQLRHLDRKNSDRRNLISYCPKTGEMAESNSNINSVKLELLAIERRIRLRTRVIAFIEESESVTRTFAIPPGSFQILIGFFCPLLYWRFYQQLKFSEVFAVVMICCGIYSIYSGASSIIRSLTIYHWTERVRRRIAELDKARQRLEETVSNNACSRSPLANSTSQGTKMRFSRSLVLLFVSVSLALSLFGQDKKPNEDEVIRIDTQLVDVPIIVTDKTGRPLVNLKQSNFIVHEDGKRQEVTEFAATSAPFEVALLLDTSGSTRADLPLIQRAAANFIASLRPGDRVSVIGYSTERTESRATAVSEVLSVLTDDRSSLKTALEAVKTSNGTPYYDSLLQVLEKVFSEKPTGDFRGRRALVALTDGVDSVSSADFEQVKEELGKAGIICYFIQVETRHFFEENLLGDCQTSIRFSTDQIRRYYRTFYPASAVEKKSDFCRLGDFERLAISKGLYQLADKEMQDLARVSGGKVFPVADLSDARNAFKSVAQEIGTKYSLGYYSSNEKPDSTYRRIRIELKGVPAGTMLRAREGYTAPEGKK